VTGAPGSGRLPAGLVLAGGTSRRMGGADKALALLGGRPLVAHALDRLRPQARAVAISSNASPAAFAALAAPVLADPDEARLSGPLSGILSGLIWADRVAGCGHLLTAAVDTPLFPRDLGARLTAAAEGHAGRIAVARSGGRWHPVFALWPVAMAEALRNHLRERDDFSVMRFLDGRDFVGVEFDLGPDGSDPFFNVNTPGDLVASEAMIKGSRP
jgi:molybdopterin-guanine dinucleotide biosynthesis protein A